MCIGTFQPNIQKDNEMDAEGYHTYLVSINDNQTYPIKYKISSGAVIETISSETSSSPILNIIVREVPQGGNLTIQLPTKLLGLYSAGGYSVAEGTMCAAIIGKSFPSPIESNLNFTTVEFPLMNHDGVDEMIYITGNYQQPSTTSEFSSPLKQFKSGISASDVQCTQGLELVTKAEDSSPACVKPDTAQKLIERGWAKITVTIANLDVVESNMTQTSKESIRIIPEYPISTGINKNGTITDSETIEILFDNFKQTNSSLVIQILNPQGTIYRVDNIPHNDIQSDGFYKYQIYIKGNQSAMGQYKVIVTHDNATASISTYLSNVVP